VTSVLQVHVAASICRKERYRRVNRGAASRVSRTAKRCSCGSRFLNFFCSDQRRSIASSIPYLDVPQREPRSPLLVLLSPFIHVLIASLLYGQNGITLLITKFHATRSLRLRQMRISSGKPSCENPKTMGFFDVA
jgi:hypothetical protein